MSYAGKRVIGRGYHVLAEKTGEIGRCCQLMTVLKLLK